LYGDCFIYNPPPSPSSTNWQSVGALKKHEVTGELKHDCNSKREKKRDKEFSGEATQLIIGSYY